MVGKRFNGSGNRDRPRTQLPGQALSSYDPHLSSKDITESTAHSSDQFVFARPGCKQKHRRFLSMDRVTRVGGHLHCRVCAGGGSSYEQQCYKLLDRMVDIQAYAVEACAVPGKVQFQGGVLHVGKHKWDVVLLQPAKVLIAVQGEQHTSKEDTRRNNRGHDLADQKARDMALAQAAISSGYHVVWLHPGDRRGLSARWQVAIQAAIDAVRARQAPKLYHG